MRERFGLRPETPVILFLSRLHPKKQPEILLKSLALLQRKIPETSLLLAGGGDIAYVESLRALARDLGLEGRALFPGIVTGGDKNLLLAGADCFALASQTENFSIATAEALAAGLPVAITPDIQISHDIVQADAGRICPPDPAEFSAALGEILSTPALAARLSQNARKLAAKRYSWNAIAPALKRIYESILAGQAFPESPFQADA